MCRFYARMRNKRKDYSQLMKKSFIAKQSGGIVPRNTGGASISPFFVNEHHRLAFKAAYLDIYTYFFTTQIPNPFGKVTTSYKAGDTWGQKFQQFYQSDPASFDELAGVFVLERRWKMGMPAFWTVSAPGSGAAPLSAEAAASEPLVSTLVY